jgi:hypothetical protein
LLIELFLDLDYALFQPCEIGGGHHVGRLIADRCAGWHKVAQDGTVSGSVQTGRCSGDSMADEPEKAQSDEHVQGLIRPPSLIRQPFSGDLAGRR